MRFVFVPWVVLTLVVAASEVASPCEQVAAREQSEPIETITRDIALASSARARIDGARVGGRLSTTYGDIWPRATVTGVLRFKRDVQLLVSESAKIGPVEGATPVMFATQQPPN